MLKKILIAILAIVAVLVVVIAMQPSEFRVERSATMQAPPADVFAQVNDFHKWDAWSPWAKLDPNAKVSFDGPESGEGAVMTWAGNDKVGKGSVTVVESRPDELIKTKADWDEPFEGTAMSEFAFKPQGDQTQVTWTMSGHHNFIAKAFCLFMNGKKMMADDMDKGLANMKSVVETAKTS